MNTKRSIEEFFIHKKFAIAGVSRNPKKFGHRVFTLMKEKGFEIYPINPNIEQIDNQTYYKDVFSLPDEINSILILTKPSSTLEVVKQAIEKGIKNIWIQQMSHSKEAIELAQNNNINLIYNACIFMYADPVDGMHKFHRSVYKLFGKLPK